MTLSRRAIAMLIGWSFIVGTLFEHASHRFGWSRPMFEQHARAPRVELPEIVPVPPSGYLGLGVASSGEPSPSIDGDYTAIQIDRATGYVLAKCMPTGSIHDSKGAEPEK